MLKKITKRLVVRPLSINDYDRWREAHESFLDKRNRWDIDRMKPTDLSMSKYRALVSNIRKSHRDDSSYYFSFFRKDGGQLVGFAALMDVSRGHFHNAYVSYRIFNKHWGLGLGKEGLRAVVDIAFRDLKMHRLEVGIEPDNKRSIALIRSLGFRKEGFSKNRILLKGRWVDLVLYVMTSEDLRIKWKPK